MLNLHKEDCSVSLPHSHRLVSSVSQLHRLMRLDSLLPRLRVRDCLALLNLAQPTRLVNRKPTHLVNLHNSRQGCSVNQHSKIQEEDCLGKLNPLNRPVVSSAPLLLNLQLAYSVLLTIPPELNRPVCLGSKPLHPLDSADLVLPSSRSKRNLRSDSAHQQPRPQRRTPALANLRRTRPRLHLDSVNRSNKLVLPLNLPLEDLGSAHLPLSQQERGCSALPRNRSNKEACLVLNRTMRPNLEVCSEVLRLSRQLAEDCLVVLAVSCCWSCRNVWPKN